VYFFKIAIICPKLIFLDDFFKGTKYYCIHITKLNSRQKLEKNCSSITSFGTAKQFISILKVVFAKVLISILIFSPLTSTSNTCEITPFRYHTRVITLNYPCVIFSLYLDCRDEKLFHLECMI
jgi:hypothetical protein